MLIDRSPRLPSRHSDAGPAALPEFVEVAPITPDYVWAAMTREAVQTSMLALKQRTTTLGSVFERKLHDQLLKELSEEGHTLSPVQMQELLLHPDRYSTEQRAVALLLLKNLRSELLARGDANAQMLWELDDKITLLSKDPSLVQFLSLRKVPAGKAVLAADPELKASFEQRFATKRVGYEQGIGLNWDPKLSAAANIERWVGADAEMAELGLLLDQDRGRWGVDQGLNLKGHYPATLDYFQNELLSGKRLQALILEKSGGREPTSADLQAAYEQFKKEIFAVGYWGLGKIEFTPEENRRFDALFKALRQGKPAA